MPIYKNVARRIAVQVRVTGGATPYVAATWANSSVAKMYYSQDGSAGTAISPSRIDATLGGWELSVGILTSSVWNCDELRIWWEGSGIDFGEVVFYPEADYSSTKAGYLTGDAFVRLGAPVGASISADIAGVQSDTDNIQTRLPAALVSGRMDSSVGAIANDAITAAATASDFSTEVATGVWALTTRTLSSHGVAAIWDALVSGITTANSIGKRLIDNLTGDIFSRLGSPVGASVSADIAAAKSDTAAIKTKTDQLTFTVSNQVDANALTGSSGPSAETIADAVWDEALSGHLTAGSTGNALNAAGSSGDPWATSLPGAYGAGSAGKIIGDNLNATVSSRASQTSVDAVDDLIDTEITAIFNRIGAPAGASISADIAGVQSDTNDIQTRLPAALQSGRMVSAVGAMDADVITNTAIAANAIGASELASDAVAEIQSGLATATELANVKAIAQSAATSAAQLG